MSVAFLFNGNSRFFHLHTLHLCQGVCTWCKVACIVTAKASVRFVSIHQPRKNFRGWFFILRPQRSEAWSNDMFTVHKMLQPRGDQHAIPLSEELIQERKKFYVGPSCTSLLHKWNFICPWNAHRAFIEKPNYYNLCFEHLYRKP